MTAWTDFRFEEEVFQRGKQIFRNLFCIRPFTQELEGIIPTDFVTVKNNKKIKIRMYRMGHDADSWSEWDGANLLDKE